MKELYIFAGPNGSGKTTLTEMFYSDDSKKQIPFINADIYEKEKFAHILDESKRNLAAAKFAEAKRYSYLKAGKSFAYETVLSTDRHIKFMQESHEQGYFITTYYVLTENADINVERIKKRVKQGGHDVDEQKTKERYMRCLALLPQVMENSDFFVLFDNSKKYQMVCFKYNGKYYLVECDTLFDIGKLKTLFDFQVVSLENIRAISPSNIFRV